MSIYRKNTHPSLERFPHRVSIAHVSKYPENDNAGLEPIHSSLGDIRGVSEGGVDEGEERCKKRDQTRRAREGRKENKLSAGGVELVQTHRDDNLIYTTQNQVSSPSFGFSFTLLLRKIFTFGTFILFLLWISVWVREIDGEGYGRGGIKREAVTFCREQAGSHESQKEKQVSTIAFVALRYSGEWRCFQWLMSDFIFIFFYNFFFLILILIWCNRKMAICVSKMCN